MKKLLFILSAIFVSVMGWAQLNPYAYGLSSDWDATNQTLTVDFKLNAKANKIEIFAVDRANNNKTYKIHEITSPGNTLDYSIPIHINGKGIDDICLPTGKNLTFAVKVDGTARNTPGTPVYIEQNRPYSPHGVAVNNHQNSQDFGAVYVTECTNGVSGNATWGWLSDKGRSLLEYNPRLEYSNFYRKSSDFSLRNLTWKSDGSYNSGGNLLEPHRVVVSDDGRIFVSSYNQNGSNDKIAVWEFNRQTKQYTPLIYHNTAYGDRVVAMDIKGTTATGLKMILAFFEVNTDGKRGYYIYEYTISGNTGSATATVVGQKCQYVPSNGDGTQYQRIQDLLKESVNLHYFCYTDGFTDIAYGTKDPTTVYIGIDYFVNTKFRTSLVYFNNGTYNYHNTTNEGQRYGGGGLVTYKGANGEDLIAMGRCQLGNNTEDDGRIQVYALNSSNVPSDIRYTIPTKTKNVVNDIAIDCANNLYAVSFTDNAATKAPSGTGRLLAVAMPYSGTITTYCPTSNADDKEYFILPERTELPENLTSTALDRIAKNNSGGCGCNISLNRPMQADMFSTICLPFDLNISSLPDDHPYKNADILAFDDVVLSADDNGNILELSFVPINGQMVKNTPYLIRPKGSDISNNVLFDNVTIDSYKGFSDPAYLVTKNNVTFWGIIPSAYVQITDPENDVVLILVADNRLARVTANGTFLGFRGFFYFDRSKVPANVGARIAWREDTTTGLLDAQEQTVDVNKFLREGRVYIRVGEALYTLDGQKVE
jgi:hypothetical protein